MIGNLAKIAKLLAAAGIVVSIGCGGQPPDQKFEQVAAADEPIFGGQSATTCQWPTTVSLSKAGCSGTLVHPLIVTTAAHCGSTETTITFGETLSAPARKVPVDFCKTYQGENGPVQTDFAFCKLKTPVLDVPIVPILMGCETDILQAGQHVIVAGFGANSDNSGPNDGYGTKRWVETTVNRPDTGRGIQVGGNGKAPCFGDSGGPAFVKLADGTWRVFGIDSEGTGASCGAGDIMVLIHHAVPWIEQQSGVDITPCHTAEGAWDPSPDCRGFSLAPDSTGRAWANGCAEPMLSGPASTCGPAAGSDGGTSDAAAHDASVANDAGGNPRDAGGSADARSEAGGGGTAGAGGAAGSGGTGGTGGAAGGGNAAGSGGSGGTPTGTGTTTSTGSTTSGGGAGGVTSTGSSSGVGGANVSTTGVGGAGGSSGDSGAGGGVRHSADDAGGCACRTRANAGAPRSLALWGLAGWALLIARRTPMSKATRRRVRAPKPVAAISSTRYR